MGGREKLAGIRNVRYQTIGHTIVTEQSYRQQPFFTAYQHDTLTVDFVNGRILDAGHLTWPESDPGQFENDQTLVATPTAGVYRGAHGDTPCGLSDLDQADDAIALGPERLLLTASQAADLHYVEPRWLRDTPHAAVAFTWRGMPTIVLLNAANHLPDAMLRTRTFQDFWFAWGDVQQLVYFDNWHLVDGIVMPTVRIEARNGARLAVDAGDGHRLQRGDRRQAVRDGRRGRRQGRPVAGLGAAVQGAGADDARARRAAVPGFVEHDADPAGRGRAGARGADLGHLRARRDRQGARPIPRVAGQGRALDLRFVAACRGRARGGRRRAACLRARPQPA
jgi:hypothetical protein